MPDTNEVSYAGKHFKRIGYSTITSMRESLLATGAG